MSGKKAGLTCGATGLGGAAIGKPTTTHAITEKYIALINNSLPGIGKSGLIIGTGGGGYK